MTRHLQAMARGPRQSSCKSLLQVHLMGGQWAEKLDALLCLNERQHKQAMAQAQSEYEQFAAQRQAALEAEGVAVHMLSSNSTDDGALAELDKVAKRLTKTIGASK